MKHHDFYMLSDDMKDFARDANHISTYVIKLGKQWAKARAKHYKTMPVLLLRMLDEISDVMICEESGCRELVYYDWDFCKTHGVPPAKRANNKRKKRVKKKTADWLASKGSLADATVAASSAKLVPMMHDKLFPELKYKAKKKKRKPVAHPGNDYNGEM